LQNYDLQILRAYDLKKGCIYYNSSPYMLNKDQKVAGCVRLAETPFACIWGKRVGGGRRNKDDFWP
jgi:hypothetical protein